MGGTGSSGPTLQQQQLETQQALTAANLNEQENATRKAMLNALQGTRVFRGSALSRATRGNTNTPLAPVGAPSASQTAAETTPPSTSLVDGFGIPVASGKAVTSRETGTTAAATPTGSAAAGGRGGGAGVGAQR